MVSYLYQYIFIWMNLNPLLLLSLTLTHVLSFWDVGHMLTANIAEIRLQRDAPQALQKFKDLV